MVFEKVMPASRLPEMGRGAACRAYDLAQSLNVIHRHYRRIHGQDHCVFDEDRLMAHILDCVGTLRRMQALFDPYNTDNLDLQTAREETFQKALYLMLHHSTGAGTEGAISSLCEAFPGFGDTSASSQSTNKKSWQPTHWAVIAMDNEPHQSNPVAQSNLVARSPVKSEQDDHYVRTVQLFVGHDVRSLSLSQFGVDPTLPNLLYIPHWQEQHTPADLLCMQAKANLDVINHLDQVVPGIFTQGCALELAARHSTSRTLVEFLLQQQPRGESKSTFKGELHRYPGYPLTLLLKRAASHSHVQGLGLSLSQGHSQGQGQESRVNQAGNHEDNGLFDDLFDLLIQANHTSEVVGDALHCLLSSSCTSLGGVKRLELCKKMIALQPDAIQAKCGGVRDCFPLQTYIEGLARTPPARTPPAHTSPGHPASEHTTVSMAADDDKNDDLNARKALFNYLLTIHPDAVKAMDAEGLVPVFRAVGGSHTPPDIVKTLVTKYPDGLRLRDRDGLSPAHEATEQGTRTHLEILLQAYPASVAERTEPRAGLGGGDENVLQYACRGQNDPYHLSAYFRQKQLLLLQQLQLQRSATATATPSNQDKLITLLSSTHPFTSQPPEEADNTLLTMASGRARQTFRPIDTDKVMTLLSFLKNKTSLHGITCWRQELLHARDSNGWMLLHHLACYCTSIDVFQAVYESEPDCFHDVAIKVIETETGELMFLDPTDEADVVHMQSDDTGWDASFCPYLRTPLHMFLAMNQLDDPLDHVADTFRYLVAISDPHRVLSARDSYGHTPYDFLASDWSHARTPPPTDLALVPAPAGLISTTELAVETTTTGETATETMGGALVLNENQHPHTPSNIVNPLGSNQQAGAKAYFQRIVLNACPTVNIIAYRQLNYEARRGGIYLGYIIPITALKKDERKHFLWRQLRLVEASLLQSIIMFL